MRAMARGRRRSWPSARRQRVPVLFLVDAVRRRRCWWTRRARTDACPGGCAARGGAAIMDFWARGSAVRRTSGGRSRWRTSRWAGDEEDEGSGDVDGGQSAADDAGLTRGAGASEDGALGLLELQEAARSDGGGEPGRVVGDEPAGRRATTTFYAAEDARRVHAERADAGGEPQDMLEGIRQNARDGGGRAGLCDDGRSILRRDPTVGVAEMPDARRRRRRRRWTRGCRVTWRSAREAALAAVQTYREGCGRRGRASKTLRRGVAWLVRKLCVNCRAVHAERGAARSFRRTV